ncbi:MAG: glycosyltransferase family 2 protein [Acidimicrobiales bacterium]
MTTSVVVLSYRPGDWLAGCLDSVVDQADEVVVVDNASPDGAASAAGCRVGALVVRTPRNLGFSRGVNLGVGRAHGDVVALLNDDAVAGPGWLAAARGALEDPSVAAVAPKINLSGWYGEISFDDEEHFAPGDPRPLGRQLRSVTADGVEVLDRILGPGVHPPEADAGGRWRWTAGRRPLYVPLDAADDTSAVIVDGDPHPVGRVCRLVNSAGLYLRSDGYAGDIGVGAPDDGRFDRTTDRFALSGTAFAFRSETWKQLGGMAAPYFAYYEDIDWCWRARLAGRRVVYDPAATVEHRRSATSGGATDARVRVLAERNRTLSMVRNAPLGVVGPALQARWREGPDGGVRRGIIARLPWAVSSRAALARRWTDSPRAVWDRWAGVNTTWDESPARRTPG